MGNVVLSEENCLIKIKDLKKYFIGRRSIFNLKPDVVKAVDGIDLDIRKGETLGLVGESGCGKSTLGRVILRLIPATEGMVFYNGKNLLTFDKKAMLNARRRLQIVFQDPYGSLNPRMSVEELVGAPLKVFNEGSKAQRLEAVTNILEEVGIGAHNLKRFPNEFSGGQRQRIGIARALILNPEFMVCDEPVSALDVSVRAQVLNLFRDIQKKKHLTYLFISHDLSVIKHISDRIAVMYLGKIVELCVRDRLYENPLHPYTKGLLAAIPIPDPGIKRYRAALIGDVLNSYNPLSGCKFHAYCPNRTEICKEKEPPLLEAETGHTVACHMVQCKEA